MFRNLTLIFALVLCAGCHSNPYTGYDGNLQNGPIEKKTTEASSPITAQTLVDVTEGATVPVQISGKVLSGKPVFSFMNLPAFAAYDATQGTLTFTPPVGAARDPAFPGGEYKIVLVLSSTTSPQLKITKDMVVVVHANAKALVVGKFTPQAQIVEGDTFTGTIDVQTTNLPVSISGVDLPDGVKISSTPSPTTFAITYTPSFATVLASHNGTYCQNGSGVSNLCKTFNWTLNVVDSIGDSVSVAATWSVLDYRQDPAIKYTSTPDVVASSAAAPQLSATFYLQVEDPNGEAIPSLTVDSTDGQASVTTVNSGGGSNGILPFALAKVTLSGLPDTFKGKSDTVTVNVCVEDTNSNYYNCKSVPVSVTF